MAATLPSATGISPAPALILPGVALDRAERAPTPVLRPVELARARAQRATWSGVPAPTTAVCAESSRIGAEPSLIGAEPSLTLTELTPDCAESIAACTSPTPRRTQLAAPDT